MVDGADMDAVGADHFHMFLNCTRVGHEVAPWFGSARQRTSVANDAGDRK
jgi:hypothetical protein